MVLFLIPYFTWNELLGNQVQIMNKLFLYRLYLAVQIYENDLLIAIMKWKSPNMDIKFLDPRDRLISCITNYDKIII